MSTRKPRYSDYPTNDGMHAAMQAYATSFDKPPLIVMVTFSDGSKMHEVFDRATKEVFYRVHDKEEGLYSVSIHAGKYKEPFFSDKELTAKELKEGFVQWLYKHNNPQDIISIKWDKSK